MFKKRSGSVSRVLYPAISDGWRPFILTNCYQLALPLRKQEASDLPAGRTVVRSHSGRVTSLLGLAGGGVCPASAVTGTAVRSYHTISPLPVPRESGPSAVYFLRHFPAGFPGWLLATTVPYPARTFLRFLQTGDCLTHSFNL